MCNQYFSRYRMMAQEAALQKELDNETYWGKVILPPEIHTPPGWPQIHQRSYYMGEGVSTVSSPEIPNGELVGRCWIGDRLLTRTPREVDQQSGSSDCLDFSLHYYFWPGWSGIPYCEVPGSFRKTKGRGCSLAGWLRIPEGKLNSGCQGLALDFLVFDKDSQTPESGTFDQLNRLVLQKRWENDRYLIVEVMGKDRLCRWLKERLQNERGTLSTTTLPITP